LAPAEKADVTPDIWLIDLLYLAAAGHEFAAAAHVDSPDALAVSRTVHRIGF
jgi:hypothetical protein